MISKIIEALKISNDDSITELKNKRALMHDIFLLVNNNDSFLGDIDKAIASKKESYFKQKLNISRDLGFTAQNIAEGDLAEEHVLTYRKKEVLVAGSIIRIDWWTNDRVTNIRDDVNEFSKKFLEQNITKIFTENKNLFSYEYCKQRDPLHMSDDLMNVILKTIITEGGFEKYEDVYRIVFGGLSINSRNIRSARDYFRSIEKNEDPKLDIEDIFYFTSVFSVYPKHHGKIKGKDVILVKLGDEDELNKILESESIERSDILTGGIYAKSGSIFLADYDKIKALV